MFVSRKIENVVLLENPITINHAQNHKPETRKAVRRDLATTFVGALLLLLLALRYTTLGSAEKKQQPI